MPVNDILLGLLRALLVGLGGYLVKNGIVDADQWKDVIGAALILAPIVWSVISKFTASKTLMAAVNNPAAAPATPVTTHADALAVVAAIPAVGKPA